MRLIDADAFEKQINKYVEYNDDGKQEINADAVFITLHDQPTIEVNQGGDLISRQEALDICNIAIDLWHSQLGEGALIAVRDKIRDLPTIDIDLSKYSDKLCQSAYERGKAERKRGRWKGEGLGDYRCSLCGEVTKHTRTNFCPNCGARMLRGEEE